jgi:Fe-S cluster assembly protein SufD
MAAMTSTERLLQASDGLIARTSQPWLKHLRANSRERFAAAGLPTRRIEAWKYTDLAPLAGLGLRPAEAADARAGVYPCDQLPPLIGDSWRLVFVNGRFRTDLSSPLAALPGVTVNSLRLTLANDGVALEGALGGLAGPEERPLVALNTALMEDGCIVRIEAGQRLGRPIELVFFAGGAADALAFHPRHLITLGEGSSATLIERHIGVGATAYVANAVTEIVLGAHAQLRHYKVQSEGAAGFHLATVLARVEAGAAYETFVLTTGGRLARNDSTIQLNGAGARCTVGGSYLIRDRQLCDNTSLIEHRAGQTTCRQMFKGVVDGAAKAVFQGRIVVHRDAQKADGQQVSKALLLSDEAEIDQKPELEIYADDVKCSHGATAGQLDRQALFYLRSRGVSEAAASRLLIEGFLVDSFEQISHLCVRETLLESALAWLRTDHEAATR